MPNSTLGPRLAGRGPCAPQPRGTLSRLQRRWQGAVSEAEASVLPRRPRTLRPTYNSPSTHRAVQRSLSVLYPRRHSRHSRCIRSAYCPPPAVFWASGPPLPPLAPLRPMVTPVCPSPPRPAPPASRLAPANGAASSGPPCPGHTEKGPLQAVPEGLRGRIGPRGLRSVLGPPPGRSETLRGSCPGSAGRVL